MGKLTEKWAKCKYRQFSEEDTGIANKYMRIYSVLLYTKIKIKIQLFAYQIGKKWKSGDIE